MSKWVSGNFIATRRGEGAGSVSSKPPSLRHGLRDFGPLARYLSNPEVTDIFINGPDNLWIDSGSGLMRDTTWSCPGEPQLRDLATHLVALGGRHIDEANPCVDVRLHDGIRLHAVLPPIALQGTLLSVRIPSISTLRLNELALGGLFGSGRRAEQKQRFVEAAVKGRSNILITGAGGSGKTTLLGALLSSVPKNERMVAIEDVAELCVDHPHFVSLEARQSNLEGAGGIGLGRLLREALRMRPDRLILGECRGSEIRELLSALNTGHDGGAGTLHANSLGDVPARIEALGSLAQLGPEAIARQTVSAIGLIFHLERREGVRRLTQIGRFALDNQERLVVEEVAVAPSHSVSLGVDHA